MEDIMLVKKVVSLLMVFSVIFLQLPLCSLATEPMVSRDQYSQIYTNTDLSKTVEVFPYSLFSQNEDTQMWEKKQNVEVKNGSISYVSQSEPNSNFSLDNEVKMGTDANNQLETFIKFGDSLPALNGGLFLGAKLRLKELNNDYDCYYCQYHYNEEFSIYKISEPWKAQELTWVNKPDVMENLISSKTLAMPVGGSYYAWDVSGLVLDWYKNPEENYGLAIKATANQPNPNVKTFTKLNQDLRQMPVLQIRFSPKPNAPSGIATGLQTNSEKGFVNLQWSSVTGAKGYKVYLYNGNDYEQVYEGSETKWSSLGKNLWPSKDQILNGELTLRKDGSGTELSDHPGSLYQQLGDTEKATDTYYFKVSAYNEYGETEISDVTTVKMPDTTAPSVPKNIKASSELISNFTLTWDPSVDQSPIEYNVKLTTDSGYEVFTGTAQTNSITIPENHLTSRSTYQVSVKAVDKSSNQSNFSNYSPPVNVTARKKDDAQLVSMSYPSSIQEAGSSPYIKIVLKNTGTDSWTPDGGYLLKAGDKAFSVALAPTDIIKTGDTKTFEYKLPTDISLGTTQINWRMLNQKLGYFGDNIEMAISFEDRMKPQISLISPTAYQRVYGKINLEGSIVDYQLKNYSISYGYGETPTNWIEIKDSDSSVVNFGEWETTNLKNGTYNLRIEALDTSGGKSTLDRIVYVKNPVPLPTVLEVTDKSTKVTGTAKQGTTVLVFKNESQIGNGTASEAGTFSIPIPLQMAGTELKIISMDGNDASDTLKVRVKDITPPEQPIVHTVTNKGTAITGKTEPFAIVLAKLPDKTYKVKADAYGKFSITIPIQNFGTSIFMTVQDSAQLKSKEKKITVTRVAPNIPTVNTVNNKATQVSGKSEKYATMTVGIGTRSYTARADAYGVYKIAIPVQNSGTTLKVTAKDSTGASSVPRTITVIRIAPNKPTVHTVYNNVSSISGKTEKYATVTTKIGSKNYSKKADAYGNFKIAIPVQKSGVKLNVTAKDNAGNISAPAPVTVIRAAPDMPTVNAVRYYSTSVTGKTEKYAAVNVKIGTRTYSAKANSYGNFKVSIPKQKKGTKISISAKDAKGKISATRTLTVY